MRKISIVLGALLSLFIISCEGPEGPPGFDGFDGRDGQDGLEGEAGIQGQVFEVDGVDFLYNATDNLHETIITFSDYTSFEVIKEDAILVYRYDGSVEFDDGTIADAWGLIPQNFFVAEGTLQYVSSHTLFDVQILIDGNFDLTNISTDFTQGQIFRVVIVPSEFAANGKLDKSNIETVMNAMGITEKDVQKVNL